MQWPPELSQELFNSAVPEVLSNKVCRNSRGRISSPGQLVDLLPDNGLLAGLRRVTFAKMKLVLSLLCVRKRKKEGRRGGEVKEGKRESCR